MEQETLDVLEYDKIRTLLADKAGSLLGKELARTLQPTSDFAEAQARLAETDEAVAIRATSVPPLGGIFDIREKLQAVGKGATLEVADFADILSTMRAMRSVKRYFKELAHEAPILKGRAVQLEILGELERRLENSIDEHGELLDSASVELSRIRRELRHLQARLKNDMGAILHDADTQKFFQEAIVTVRDGRYVVPVKQEYRQSFPGIIHDRSASGSTLFIEPMAMVGMNNDIRELQAAERNEIVRLLRLLSAAINKNREALMQNCAILAAIDFAFAKAQIAESMQATRPLLNDEGRTHLQAARHPLLAKESVVPIDLRLGLPDRMLLVTGPNTGGKTVSLKTMGLLALMAASGLYLPVAEGSEVAIYHQIYTVIGDEQSLEQSLSTFSAHMRRLVSLLENVEANDLALLDEIGAGTDPEEGAALAMAILERLLAIKASVIVTTHYSELKTFAYATAGVENASVEFDVETLRPTYRLRIGMPGASNAFAISERLGLSRSLVLRAQQFIEADHAQFEQVVNALEREKRMYEQRNAEIIEREARAARLEAKAVALKTDLEQKKDALFKKARQDSAAMVRRTRREAEAIIKSLKEQYNDQGIVKRQKAMQEARAKLREAEGRTADGLTRGNAYKTPIDLQKLAVGDTVYIRRLDKTGTVLHIQGRELEIEIGSLHLKAKARECRFVAKKAEARVVNPLRNTVAFTGLQKVSQARREIDLRGRMVDEAEAELSKFLDDAVMAGLDSVLIIHGKGTGALRKGLHAYLKNHRNVLHYQFADMDEGGAGATVVELK